MGIKDLFEFIDRAERNRKYLPNTANNYRTPLKIIEGELSDEERSSVDLIKEHLDQILHFVYSKNPDKWSASSIEEYKRRLRRLIVDFEIYGNDPAKLASWSKPIVTRKSKADKPQLGYKIKDRNEIMSGFSNVQEVSSLTKHEEVLSKGKAVIFTPSELDHNDINVLRAYINYLEIKIKKQTDAGGSGRVASPSNSQVDEVGQPPK